jgi:hypothetical protein
VRSTLNFHDDKVRTAFLISMAQSGVLIINSHNISYAHGEAELSRLKRAYENTCTEIRWAIDHDALDDIIGDSPVVSAAPLRTTG